MNKNDENNEIDKLFKEHFNGYSLLCKPDDAKIKSICISWFDLNEETKNLLQKKNVNNKFMSNFCYDFKDGENINQQFIMKWKSMSTEIVKAVFNTDREITNDIKNFIEIEMNK